MAKDVGNFALDCLDTAGNAILGAADGVMEGIFGYQSPYMPNKSSYYWGKAAGNLTTALGGTAGTFFGGAVKWSGGALAFATGGLSGGAIPIGIGIQAVSAGVTVNSLARFDNSVLQAKNFNGGSSSGRNRGSGKTPRDMSKRGWSDDMVNDVTSNPHTTRSATNKVNGNPATAYYDSVGNYVVKDNVTGNIVQYSEYGNTGWIPDSSIVNPYKP